MKQRDAVCITLSQDAAKKSRSILRQLTRTQRMTVICREITKKGKALDDFNYIGSYQFGADDSSFYAITSGVSGLCEPVNCSIDDCNAK